MIAVDSSVWIGHFLNTVAERVRLLCSLFGNIALMEVLRGARDEPHAAPRGRELHEFDIVHMLGEALAVRVARNYRALRTVGFTVRKTPDLIIATYCIEHHHALLHNARNIEAMRDHLGLQVV